MHTHQPSAITGLEQPTQCEDRKSMARIGIVGTPQLREFVGESWKNAGPRARSATVCVPPENADSCKDCPLITPLMGRAYLSGS